ncbi:MAG: hypothetical protein LBH98_06445 [Chitinispirillales bacterium]|jgi:hypothetical protein|nr:hypothetical protein [Chitinispirillales bacterium]
MKQFVLILLMFTLLVCISCSNDNGRNFTHPNIAEFSVVLYAWNWSEDPEEWYSFDYFQIYARSDIDTIGSLFRTTLDPTEEVDTLIPFGKAKFLGGTKIIEDYEEFEPILRYSLGDTLIIVTESEFEYGTPYVNESKLQDELYLIVNFGSGDLRCIKNPWNNSPEEVVVSDIKTLSLFNAMEQAGIFNQPTKYDRDIWQFSPKNKEEKIVMLVHEMYNQDTDYGVGW